MFFYNRLFKVDKSLFCFENMSFSIFGVIVYPFFIRNSYYIFFAVYWGLIFVRYYLVHGMTGLPAKMYLGGVVARTHVVALISAILPIIIFLLMPEGIARLISVCVSSVLSSCIVIYAIGLDKTEKEFIINKLSVVVSTVFHR